MPTVYRGAMAESERRARGRPSKLTPELIEEMCNALRMGVYLETAAAVVGVDTKTPRNWLKRGREELDRLAELDNPNAKPRARERLYVDFFLAYKRAQSEFEIEAQSAIAYAAYDKPAKFDEHGNEIEPFRRGSWQAAAWRLERKFPNRYGRKYRATASASTPTGGGGDDVGSISLTLNLVDDGVPDDIEE